MAEFTVIETQEQLDNVIKDRLERERNAVRKEFADYDSIKKTLEDKTKSETELTRKLGEQEKKIEDLNSKLSKSETDSAKTRIAYELGLPIEMCSRLAGTSEEEIRKDAEMLCKFVRRSGAAPLYNPEGANSSKEETAYKTLLSGVRQQ